MDQRACAVRTLRTKSATGPHRIFKSPSTNTGGHEMKQFRLAKKRVEISVAVPAAAERSACGRSDCISTWIFA